MGHNEMEELRARLRRLDDLEGRISREAQLESKLKQALAKIDDYEAVRVLLDGRMGKLEAEVAAQAGAKRKLERELEVAQLLLKHQEFPQHQVVITTQQQQQQRQRQRQPPPVRTSPSPVPLSSSSSKGPRTFDGSINGLDRRGATDGEVDDNSVRRDSVLQEQVLRMYEQLEALKQDREFATMQTSAARGEAAAAAAGQRDTIAAFGQLKAAYTALEAELSQSSVAIEKKDAENQHLKIQQNIQCHQLRQQLATAEKERDALHERTAVLSRSEAQRTLEARAMEGQLAESRAAREAMTAQVEGLSVQLGLVRLHAPPSSAAGAAESDGAPGTAKTSAEPQVEGESREGLAVEGKSPEGPS